MKINRYILSVLFLFCLPPMVSGQKNTLATPLDTVDELTDTSGSVTRISSTDSLQLISPHSKVDSLIGFAHTFMGNRYRRGGTSTKGFDCSGYTLTVYKKFGIKLPHTSAGQGLMGIEIQRQNIKKGDLILFRGRSRRGKRIGHVGIVVSAGEDGIRFIHSSTSEGVRIDRLDYQYYKKRYIKTVRIPELYR